MRYADWLRFRADMFLIACLYFLANQIWWAGTACAAMFAIRNWTAARIAASALYGKEQQPDRRKNGN